MIYGNTVGGSGGGGSSIDKTFILEDADGNELVGVIVSEEVVFTADANDIRKDKVAATQNGVTSGTKEIPTYHTTEGYKIVTDGSKFVVMIQDYDYTKLQAIFCPFNSSVAKSVAAEKVAIDNSVYSTKSATAEAVIVKDSTNGRVDFGITNNSGMPYIIRYFSYKEIY